MATIRVMKCTGTLLRVGALLLLVGSCVGCARTRAPSRLGMISVNVLATEVDQAGEQIRLTFEIRNESREPIVVFDDIGDVDLVKVTPSGVLEVHYSPMPMDVTTVSETKDVRLVRLDPGDSKKWSISYKRAEILRQLLWSMLNEEPPPVHSLADIPHYVPCRLGAVLVKVPFLPLPLCPIPLPVGARPRMLLGTRDLSGVSLFSGGAWVPEKEGPFSPALPEDDWGDSSATPPEPALSESGGSPPQKPTAPSNSKGSGSPATQAAKPAKAVPRTEPDPIPQREFLTVNDALIWVSSPCVRIDFDLKPASRKSIKKNLDGLKVYVFDPWKNLAGWRHGAVAPIDKTEVESLITTYVTSDRKRRTAVLSSKAKRGDIDDIEKVPRGHKVKVECLYRSQNTWVAACIVEDSAGVSALLYDNFEVGFVSERGHWRIVWLHSDAWEHADATD